MAEGRALRFPMMQLLRSASDSVVDQLRKVGLAGVTHNGKRDLYEVCGYDRNLRLRDYRERYQRGDIASRIVEAFPEATWRGSGHDCVYDSDDSQETTPFEQAWNDLNKRLKVWSVFYRADVLAGLGHYAVILIGAPGDYASPLPDTLKPKDIAFLTPFCQEDAPIVEYVTKSSDPRCGQPLAYQLKRTSVLRKTIEQTRAPLPLDLTRQVHYSRIIHIAEGKLDDDVFGIPRLERVWNRLDDLDKMVGAGAEAFWLRANQGIQFDLDPEIELEPDEAARFKKEINDYIHRQSRVVSTRGVTAHPFGSDVARFDENLAGVISLISATTKIPQRLLLGSERGELASTQDRDTWRERVQDRRTRFAEPEAVRPFVERLIERGALPKPQVQAKVAAGPGAKGRPVDGVVPGEDAAKVKGRPFFPPKSQTPATDARAAAIRPITGPPFATPVDSDPALNQHVRGDNPTGVDVVVGEIVDDQRDESPNFKLYWDEVLDTPATERLETATLAKGLGPTVITDAEIRDVYLGMEPMSEEDLAAAKAVEEQAHAREIEKVKAKGPSPFGGEPGEPGEPGPPKPGVGKPDGTNGRTARPTAAEEVHHEQCPWSSADASRMRSACGCPEGWPYVLRDGKRYDPRQPRAPKGKDNGGQWVEPGGGSGRSDGEHQNSQRSTEGDVRSKINDMDADERTELGNALANSRADKDFGPHSDVGLLLKSHGITGDPLNFDKIIQDAINEANADTRDIVGQMKKEEADKKKAEAAAKKAAKGAKMPPEVAAGKRIADAAAEVAAAAPGEGVHRTFSATAGDTESVLAATKRYQATVHGLLAFYEQDGWHAATSTGDPATGTFTLTITKGGKTVEITGSPRFSRDGKTPAAGFVLNVRHVVQQ